MTCLDHEGRLVWSYDTVAHKPESVLPNLNASVALGRFGVATASSNGDVLYIPYSRMSKDRFSTDAEPVQEGPVAVVLNAGGVPGSRVRPRDTIAVRLLHCKDGYLLPAHIRASSTGVLSPDRRQVHLVPDSDRISLKLDYQIDERQLETEQTIQLEIEPGEPGDLPRRMRFSGMSFQFPSILPTFDQIGLASLSIDVAVLEQTDDHVLAWGTQHFGLDPSGHTIGVPQARVLHYPLEGTWREGTLELDAYHVLFEITAFPVPLDRLRFVAHRKDGQIRGGSLRAEADFKDALRKTPFPSFWDAVAWVRSWFPGRDPQRELEAATSMARGMFGVMMSFANGMYTSWQLVDESLFFHGIGAFRVMNAPYVESTLSVVELDRIGETVLARFSGGSAWDAPAIGLVHEGRWVRLPIGLRLTTTRDAAGAPSSCTLTLGSELWDEAWLIHDGVVRKKLKNAPAAT